MHLKRLAITILILCCACAFAPVIVDVPDFFIRTGSSGNTVCYSRLSERVPINFRSVVYEGDAFYTPGVGLGGDGSIAVTLYGRASDPDPASGDSVKCVTASADDVRLSETIVLQADDSQRISAGGNTLANLVRQDEVWVGGSLDDSTILSFPGRIDFTSGVVKANF
jgi:hypothetical protein